MNEVKRFVSIGLVLLTIFSLFMGWIAPEQNFIPAGMTVDELMADATRFGLDVSPMTPTEQRTIRQIALQGLGPYSVIALLRIEFKYDDIFDAEYAWILDIASIAFWVLVGLLALLVLRHLAGMRGRGNLLFLVILALSATAIFICVEESDTVLTAWALIAPAAMYASTLFWGSLKRTAGARPGFISFHERTKCPKCDKAYDGAQLVCPNCGAYIE